MRQRRDLTKKQRNWSRQYSSTHDFAIVFLAWLHLNFKRLFKALIMVHNAHKWAFRHAEHDFSSLIAFLHSLFLIISSAVNSSMLNICCRYLNPCFKCTLLYLGYYILSKGFFVPWWSSPIFLPWRS